MTLEIFSNLALIFFLLIYIAIQAIYVVKWLVTKLKNKRRLIVLASIYEDEMKQAKQNEWMMLIKFVKTNQSGFQHTTPLLFYTGEQFLEEAVNNENLSSCINNMREHVGNVTIEW